MQLMCQLLLLVFLTLVSANQFEPVEDLEVNEWKQQITKDHVLDELEFQINTKEKKDMTDRELQFHYFKLHDFDNNNLLDGLEIVKALKHNQEHAAQSEAHPHPPVSSDEEIIAVVDGVLTSDDRDKDGYVSFYEFMAGQEL